MDEKIFEYETVIHSSAKWKGVAFVPFPFDIVKEFGKNRIKVNVAFDGEFSDACIINMGEKNEDGTVCYLIKILKEMRAKIGKEVGDKVQVTVRFISKDA